MLDSSITRTVSGQVPLPKADGNGSPAYRPLPKERVEVNPTKGYNMTRGDWVQVDDLPQETFVRAWRRLDTFRGECRFSTGFLGIAANELQQRVRRDRRRLQSEAQNAPWSIWTPAMAPRPHGYGCTLTARSTKLSRSTACECQKLVGVDKSTLTQWEQGKHKPRRDRAVPEASCPLSQRRPRRRY